MPLRLHLGCGEIRLPGWRNIDARLSAATDQVADIAALTPAMFPEAVSEIYACHVLEHFGFGVAVPNATAVLRSWVNLLAPGGQLMVSVPDLQKVGAALAACPDTYEQWNFVRCIYGGCEYAGNRHFIGFTRFLLREMMHAAGLVDIRPFCPFAPDTSRFTISGVFISLNLEGRRA